MSTPAPAKENDEVVTKPPSTKLPILGSPDPKIPRVPKIHEDGTWYRTYDGVLYQFREAKRKERRDAQLEAARLSPQAPGLDEQAILLSMVMSRKNDQGAWEPVPYEEISERGESFASSMYKWYEDGYFALQLKVKNWLKNYETETVQMSEYVSSSKASA